MKIDQRISEEQFNQNKIVLRTFKDLIESKLGLEGMLLMANDCILVPNDKILTRKFIKENCLDDLFEYHSNTLIFKNRMLSLVSEITGRKLKTGHYFFEL